MQLEDLDIVIYEKLKFKLSKNYTFLSIILHIMTNIALNKFNNIIKNTVKIQKFMPLNDTRLMYNFNNVNVDIIIKKNFCAIYTDNDNTKYLCVENKCKYMQNTNPSVYYSAITNNVSGVLHNLDDRKLIKFDFNKQDYTTCGTKFILFGGNTKYHDDSDTYNLISTTESTNYEQFMTILLNNNVFLTQTLLLDTLLKEIESKKIFSTYDKIIQLNYKLSLIKAHNLYEHLMLLTKINVLNILDKKYIDIHLLIYNLKDYKII